ncbi:hypothetical protein [Rhodococcus sp. HNM0569]|uniref:hypothetical protein n=1 Tax=Rhodococcus sp. HNM0569 TaxID=2716340 RepID=UPI00146C0F40|nr:hypothetical protein [Rhodococcus sp. HNM0569]NLU83406.1 hypothetical protein [Rhodococcus sp. HNM0569]
MGRAVMVLATAACAVAGGCATTSDGSAYAAGAGSGYVTAAPQPSSDVLRLLDPCALLDEATLTDAGRVAQFGAAVQLSVCSALVDTGEVLTRIELSISPSTYADPAPNLATGTCERTFAVPGSPRPASVRVADRAGVDACPLAETLVGDAAAALVAGVPQRGADDPVAVDPCEFLAGDTATRPSGPDAARPSSPDVTRPRPYACQAGDLTVEYSLRQVGSRALLDDAVVSAGTCRWTHRVGDDIDVTRDAAELDDFTLALGRAHPVVTVSAPECAGTEAPAQAVAKRFP